MKPKREICWSCGKDRERCRAASVRQVDDRPEMEWICPSCWREGDYEKYMYEHREPK